MSLPAYDPAPPADGGRLIVLTAPLTEAIDHAGYFIQIERTQLVKPNADRTHAPGHRSKLHLAAADVLRRDLRKEPATHRGKPVKTKNRAELLASLKPKDWQYLRADNGDMPVEYVPRAAAAHAMSALT